jgi:signal transduction histidine kinase/CheY-like chemotaxis protein/PAS domain-containing protein
MISRHSLFNTLMPVNEAADFRARIKLIASEGKTLNQIQRFINKDGKPTWIHISASKLREEDGIPVYYCIFTSPSTEAPLYKGILEDAYSCIFIANRNTEKVLYVNQSLEKSFACRAEKWIGSSLDEVVNQEERMLSHEQILNLPGDSFFNFYKTYPDGRLFSIRAKAIDWNGEDAFVMHIVDESSLHKQQENLMNLVSNIPVGIGIMSLRNGNPESTFLNDSYYRMFPEPKSDHIRLYGKTYTGDMHPSDKSIFKKSIDAIQRGENYQSIDMRFLCQNSNGCIWVRMNEQVSSRESDVITIFCSFTDITTQVENRIQLEKANEAFMKQYEFENARRKLLQKGCEIAICFDISTGIVNDFRTNGSHHPSQPITSTLQIENMLTESITDNEEKAAVISMFDQETIRHNIDSGESESTIQFQIKENGDEIRWKQMRALYSKNQSSESLIAYVYIYDIDDQKCNELALASAMDQNVDFIFLLKRRTARVKVIRNRSSLSGVIEGSEMEFAELKEIFKKQGMPEKDMKRFLGNNLLDNEVIDSIRNRDGITSTFRGESIHQKQIFGFFLDGYEQYIEIVQRDVTELYHEEMKQKAALQAAVDAANKAMKAKGEFLSRMSHDIRTPMNGIIGLTRFALKSNDVNEIHRYLNQLNTSSLFMLGLLNDILTMTKIDEGKIVLKNDFVKTADLISGITAIIEAQADDKGVHFIFKAGDLTGLEYQELDPLRIQQVLLNILSNAVKYTPAGGTIEYLLTSFAKKGQLFTEHIISDTGVGMSPEFMKVMYDPFSQESNVLSAENTGTGLGLAISNELCNLMGASVSVKSEIGKGTCFTIDIPAKPATEKQFLSTRPKKPADNGMIADLAGKRILVCEDQKLNQMIIKKLLADAGMEAVCASDGKEGLDDYEISEPGYFDAILMDIRMPVMNGIEASKAIRNSGRTDSNIPIIALSANAFDDDVQASLEAGIDQHLTKPIEPAAMYEAIDHWTSCKK